VEVLVAILTVALLALVVAVISAPLRHSRAQAGVSSERTELEVAREAKYREIRDCELDYRTGKLSSEDYQATAAALRAEALEILDRLQALDGAARSGDTGAGERSVNSELR
jgi:hypothetical protein